MAAALPRGQEVEEGEKAGTGTDQLNRRIDQLAPQVFLRNPFQVAKILVVSCLPSCSQKHLKVQLGGT